MRASENGEFERLRNIVVRAGLEAQDRVSSPSYGR